MSSFDTLLDFDNPAENGPSQPTGNGTTTHSLDPFDPFGPCPILETKAGGGGNELLLNYEVTVQNGSTGVENGSDNVNLLYEMNIDQCNQQQEDDDDDDRDHFASLIKEQTTNGGRDDSEISVTETVTTGEDGSITVVTTRRSQSYDSDQSAGDNTHNSQTVEEVMSRSDDGTTMTKLITTTTESSYYDDESVDGDEPSLEERSYEQSSSEHHEEVSFEQPEQASFEQSEQESYDHPDQVSYDEQASHVQSSYEQPSREEDERSHSPSPSSSEGEHEQQQPLDQSSNQGNADSSFDVSRDHTDEHDYMSLIHPRKASSDGNYESVRHVESDYGNIRKPSEDHCYEILDLSRHNGQLYSRTRRDSSSEEEEIIKNGATFYRTKDETHTEEVRKSDDHGSGHVEHQRMVNEEVSPGQLRSPFFGDAPMPQNGVEEEPNRDPNIAREVRARDEIRFGELSNFKNKFEVGVTSKKTLTVSPDELDQVRQGSGAGNLRNQFESVARGGNNMSQAPKPVRQITPPLDTSKVVYESEVVRDPNVVRAEDVVDEGAYLPKPGMSKDIWEKFQSGRIQDSAPRTRTSVIDEIQSVEGGVFENEPQINPDVVRSGEISREADLPASGSTRNVLSKFKQMESNTGYVPSPRGIREITPPSQGKVEYISEPTRKLEKYVGKAESGVFESQPEHRADVVRSGERDEEEDLPQQGFTRSAAALFRQKQAEASRVKVSTTGRSKEITPPRDTSVVYESQPQRLPDVVRSEDRVEEDDLPQQGAARNMLAKFRQMESSQLSASTPRQMKAFTPPRDGGVYENEPDKFVPNYNTKAEGGVFENQPHHRGDVVWAEDRHEEELPESGMARNMVARFRQMSDSTKSQSPLSPKSPLDRSFKEFTPPREEPRAMSHGVQPSDMPEQYQQSSGGISESNPQHRDDVLRESDTDYYAGMPQPSTTKNLLAKFKTIQHDARVNEQPKSVRKEFSPKHVPSPKTPASAAKEGGAAARFRAVQTEKCAACQKTVYAMEKMEFNKNVYHKTCFKCSHCKNRLTPATFSVNQGILYCLNHFKQMFKTKGNYDEGFGREQYKKKWKSEPNLAGAIHEDEHPSSKH